MGCGKSQMMSVEEPSYAQTSEAEVEGPEVDAADHPNNLIQPLDLCPDKRPGANGRIQPVRVSNTAERAVTVSHLKNLCTYIHKCCEKQAWRNTREPFLLVKPAEVNLYIADKYIIRPATVHDRCSYAEWVSTVAAKMMWFCSHWWGEPVIEFTRCLEQHAWDHKLPMDVGYWVCAYVNNQHDVAGELGGEDPKDSSFARAIATAEGTVTILDKGSVTYTRIWCSYEIYLTLSVTMADRPEYKYDIYTYIPAGACPKEIDDNVQVELRGLQGNKAKYNGRTAVAKLWLGTQGSVKLFVGDRDILTDEELLVKEGNCTVLPTAHTAIGISDRPNARDADYLADGGGAPVAKAEREAKFPIDAVMDALNVKIEKGESSFEADRRRILNAITKRTSFQVEPAKSHKEYDIVNKLLAGQFAGSAWNPVFASQFKGRGDSLRTAALAKACADSGLKKFSLCATDDTFRVAGKQISSNDFQSYLAVIPKAVAVLDLKLYRPSKPLPEDAGSILAKTLGTLPNLTQLTLDIVKCNEVKDKGAEPIQAVATAAKGLQSLNVMLERMGMVDAHAEALGKALAALGKNVKTIKLDFSNNTELTKKGAVSIILGLSKLPNLENLKLFFYHNDRQGDPDHTAISEAFTSNGFKNLKKLDLDLDFGVDVEKVRASLSEKFPQLKYCYALHGAF